MSGRRRGNRRGGIGHRRLVTLLAALCAAVLLASSAVLIHEVAVRTGGRPDTPGRAEPAPSGSAIATSQGPFSAGPVTPPRYGALLGAWVKPDQFSQGDRLSSVWQLEKSLGRRLDIVTTYRRFDEDFPTPSDKAFTDAGATIMLSWAFDDTRVLSSGAADEQLRDWARRIKSLGGPVLLRFRWEMDRPNLAAAMWSPEDYIAAWRHTRAVFAQQRVHNVSWVWCPTAEGFAGGYAQPFYPGDSEVDWTCVDVYAGAQLSPLSQLLRPFLLWAKQHPKPIVIGEFGVAQAYGPTARARWLAAAAKVFRANPQIKAVSYFDSDPEDNEPEQQFQLSGPPLAAFAQFARSRYFNTRRRG